MPALTLEIERFGFSLGARVTGIDCRVPLDATTIARLREAWLEHILLHFPGQELDPAQLRGFAGQFGDLEDYAVNANRNADNPEVLVLASKPFEANGKTMAAYKTVAATWHSDFEHNVRPTTISFLASNTIPDAGGDTMFASTYASYEALSPHFRAMIDPLEGVHDYRLGPAYINSGPEERAKMAALKPPVAHHVVLTHPETGRKALYVSDRVRTFVGMSEEETAPLRDFLVAHATRPEFTYRHRWQRNDLLLWDNRCAMHIAIPDYDPRQFRRMYQCSLIGPETGYLVDAELARPG